MCSSVTSNGTSSLPTTPLSDPTNVTFHSDMRPPLGTCDQHMSVAMSTTVPTCSAGSGLVMLPSVVSSRNDLTMETIPGMHMCVGLQQDCTGTICMSQDKLD